MEIAMVDFVGALQAAAAGLKVLKDLSQVSNEYDKAELKLKIAELSGALATVQITLAEAQSEAGKKDAEIAKLQANFKEKNDGLIEHEGFYYRKGGDGKPKGRPYCPSCIQKGILMMTVKTIKPGHPKQCPECGTEIQGASSFNFE
jgi:hypothetical protein